MTLAFDLRAQIDNGVGNRVNLATERDARASQCGRQRSERRLADDEQVDIAARALAARRHRAEHEREDDLIAEWIEGVTEDIQQTARLPQ